MKKFIFLFLFFSTFSHAGTIQCSGTVEKLGLHANDKIMMRLSSMNVAIFICSTTEKWLPAGSDYSTDPETCKVMLSMLMHAKATNSALGTTWFDGDDVPASCDAWEPWKRANVRFFLY